MIDDISQSYILVSVAPQDFNIYNIEVHVSQNCSLWNIFWHLNYYSIMLV